MGVKYLHELMENNVIPNSVVEVDLIKLASNLVKNLPPHQRKLTNGPKLCLVVDGECCLNRLYGGFKSDWACGGQWSRMASFIKQFVKTLSNSNIELVVFFNGALEPQRMNEWVDNQKEEYRKFQNILSCVNRKGYAPKPLWMAPVGLRMAIRMMLRQMNVNVVSTIDDHRQEVIAYCRENNFHGLIADDAEYIAFDPPRLFSATKLTLKYKGGLLTKEYVISEVMKELELNNEKLCVVAALLGNYLLPDQRLKDIFIAANIVSTENTAKKSKAEDEQKPEDVVRKLVKYINSKELSTNLDEIVLKIFGSNDDPRGPALKQSIQYYLDGTKDGFLRYRSVSSNKHGKQGDITANVEGTDISQEPDLDTSQLATDRAPSLNDKSLLGTYEEVAKVLTSGQEDTKLEMTDSNKEISSNCDTSPNSEPLSSSNKKSKGKKDKPPVLPPVPHEVMRTVSERHSKGLMSPYIYQILSQGEIKLPVLMEDGREIPSIHSFYKPIRQMVYAIVFNLHHHRYVATLNKKSNGQCSLDIDIRVKEWVFNKGKLSHEAEYVRAEPVGWKVPTIQRLWFGTTQDDKRRRLRAFLTCMRSDVQLILNPDCVPQQLLVAAVILRYMMSFPDKKILRKPELDAFIVAALSPEFSDIDYIQELQIPKLSSRGIQLAAMFMKGIEMALLVNDACGAPIPWLMCCPWLFFDGRLFHYLYVKALSAKNLQELCENRLALVMQTERMRQAILEGLNVQFARAPIPPLAASDDLNSSYQRSFLNRMRMSPSSMSGASSSSGNRSMNAGSGRGRRNVGGGRLEIAGVVVGSWGANYNLSQPSYESSPYLMSSQVASVGNYNNMGYRPRSAFIDGGKSCKPPYGRKKFVKKDKKIGKGRGITLGSSGNMLASDISSEKSSRQNGNENKSSESDLLNGSDVTMDESFDTVINGAIGFMGEGDGPKAVKTMCDASSSLVGTMSK